MTEKRSSAPSMAAKSNSTMTPFLMLSAIKTSFPGETTQTERLLRGALLARLGLANLGQHLAERALANVEGLAALDARELTSADLGALPLVGTYDAALARERACNGLAGTLFDELEVLLAGSRRTGEVPRLENLDLLCTENLAEALADVLANVDLVKPRMSRE